MPRIAQHLFLSVKRLRTFQRVESSFFTSVEWRSNYMCHNHPSHGIKLKNRIFLENLLLEGSWGSSHLSIVILNQKTGYMIRSESEVCCVDAVTPVQSIITAIQIFVIIKYVVFLDSLLLSPISFFHSFICSFNIHYSQTSFIINNLTLHSCSTLFSL